MFTVLIAEQKYIDAIRQRNKLFFEPFLKDRNLEFCEWNPAGQTLQESVPGLMDAVGRRKNWRAVIVNSADEDQLKKQNPYDMVDFSTLAELEQPPEQPSEEDSWDEWEKAWNDYYEALSPRKEEIYRRAMKQPLTRLTTWLCFRAADYVMEDVKETKDAYDWAMEELNGDEEKPSDRLEKIERDQYRRELRFKEQLRRDFVGEKILNIAYPAEVSCISERMPGNGFFSPDSFWNRNSDSEYSAFADRNMYLDKLRFMVYDVLPVTHKDYRCDRIRFLYTVMVFATNPTPGSAMQARRLYLLESENDDTPLCILATSYDRKLAATSEIIEGEIEKIRSEMPGALTDREAEQMFCTPTQISVDLDSRNYNEEALLAEEEFGLASDVPVQELPLWNTEMRESEKALNSVVKQQKRAVRKSVDKLQVYSEVNDGNISRLNSFQMDDVRDYTEGAEDRMVASIPPDLNDISRYSNQIREKDNEVKKVMERRMGKKATIGLMAFCLGLYLLCFLPFLISNVSHAETVTPAIVLTSVMMVLMAAILFVTLFCLRRPLKKAVKAFNNEMRAVLNDIESALHRCADYLSCVCNARRGHAILNYSEKNPDEYTRSIRIRRKHQEDIRRKRAFLEEEYRDFIGGISSCDKAMAEPYEYDFDQRTEYDYPAPFLAGDCHQIEFLESGNLVTVASGYVTRITVRLEEVYDK